MEWRDLFGTSLNYFRLGFLGPRLKDNAGTLEIRDMTDAAFAAIKASLVSATGEDIELNADAAGSGADWMLTFRRPSTGMTHDLIVIWPSGDPAPNQAVTVASLVGDVITLQYTTVAAGTDKVVVDTTTVNFGDGSPIAAFTMPANAVFREARFRILTAYDGAPQISVGIVGTTSKYVPTSAVDLTQPAKTVITVTPGEDPVGTTEAIIITYADGGATVGSVKVEIEYVIPS